MTSVEHNEFNGALEFLPRHNTLMELLFGTTGTVMFVTLIWYRLNF